MPGHKGKILFYYHHFGGLGHGMRIAAICRALDEIGHSEIVVINSGKKQPELGISRYAKVLDLPALEAESGLFHGLKADDDLRLRLEKRKEILTKVRQSFKPDVFVVEHFPFGRGALADEILGLIRLLKNDGCRIYSSVRDIIDQKIDLRTLIEHAHFFDGILVHSDKVMGFQTGIALPSSVNEKIFFTGRVVGPGDSQLKDREDIRRQYQVGHRKWAVISAGGGMDGDTFIERLIRLKSRLDTKVQTAFYISAGPAMKEEQFLKLESQAALQENIVITRFDANLPDCIYAADLSISMGGYNSINNALITGTPTLIFPRSSDGEQLKRAQYFNSVVDTAPEDMSDDQIIEKIQSLIHHSRNIYRGDLNGAQKTARLLDVACDINTLKIRLDTECNLTCEMCSWKKQTMALPKGALEKLIPRARIVGIKYVAVTGGEPTMLPDIRNTLKFIKDNGLRVSLSTNGYLEPQRLKGLLPYIDVVDISMDSDDPKLHDKIRGKVGAFGVTIRSIRLLAESGLRPHINVTIRPDNFKGLHRMVPMFSGLTDSISFTLVDTNMIKKRTDRYLFSDEQLEYFYFEEAVSIIKECVKHKMKVRITPFFEEFKGKNAEYILREFLSAQKEYRGRFRKIFLPNNKKCSIPRNYLRVNPGGDLVFCCFQDDSGVAWGNVFKDDICDIVVSDEYFAFTNNAYEGKDPCWMCKKTYKANYGEDAACAKSAS